MRTHSCRLLIFSVAVLLASHARGADDGPLPKGAKARFGPEGLVFRSGGRITLLPDGKTLLLPDNTNGIRRFDAITGQPLDQRGPADGPAVVHVVASGDGKRALVASAGFATVRDALTGKPVQELKPPPKFFPTGASDAPTASISFDGAVLAQGVQGAFDKGGEYEIVVWDVEKNAILFRTDLHQPGPPVPVLSPDGKLLAARSALSGFVRPGEADPGRVVQVWDIASKKELFRAQLTPAPFAGIAAVVFSPDGGTLAGSCGDGVVDVWDVKTGKAKITLLGRTRQGKRLAFSPDGKVLAALAHDGAVQRWGVADGKPLGTTEGPDIVPAGGGDGLVFVNDGRLLAWGMAGPCPVVWEVPSGKVLTRVPEHAFAVKSIGFPAGGKEVVTASADGRVVRWDIAAGKRLAEVVPRPSRSVNSFGHIALTVSPDAAWGVAVGNPSTVYDLATGYEEFVVPVPPGFSGTSHTLPLADPTRALRVSIPGDAKKPTICTVWDVTGRRKVGEVEFEAVSRHALVAALSPDGTRLVTATTKGDFTGPQTLLVTGWDLKTGKKLGEIEDVTTRLPAHVVAVSNTTAVVATGSRLRAFDYEFGRGGDVVEPENPRGGGSWSVGVSGDGKRFAFGVRTDPPDGYGVRVYDWPSGKAVHTFTGHRTPVQAVAISPDGKTLASSSEDLSVILWDLTAVGKK